MLFYMRTLISVLLLSLLVPTTPVAEEREGLTAREAGAVRKALYGLNFSFLRNGREETILRETKIGTPSLTAEERERIADHLWNHVPTKLAVQEVLNT